MHRATMHQTSTQIEENPTGTHSLTQTWRPWRSKHLQIHAHTVTPYRSVNSHTAEPCRLFAAHTHTHTHVRTAATHTLALQGGLIDSSPDGGWQQLMFPLISSSCCLGQVTPTGAMVSTPRALPLHSHMGSVCVCVCVDVYMHVFVSEEVGGSVIHRSESRRQKADVTHHCQTNTYTDINATPATDLVSRPLLATHTLTQMPLVVVEQTHYYYLHILLTYI